jgi:hypothetical protein
VKRGREVTDADLKQLGEYRKRALFCESHIELCDSEEAYVLFHAVTLPEEEYAEWYDKVTSLGFVSFIDYFRTAPLQ